MVTAYSKLSEQAYFDKYVTDCVKLCDFDLDIFDVFTITSNSNQKLKTKPENKQMNVFMCLFIQR